MSEWDLEEFLLYCCLGTIYTKGVMRMFNLSHLEAASLLHSYYQTLEIRKDEY